jgi:hypothetical protein
MEREIDYNYETHPDTLKVWIEQAGGVEAMLRFCQLHGPQIVMDEAYNYTMALRNGDNYEYYGCSMDAFSALVVGVIQVNEHPELLKKI